MLEIITATALGAVGYFIIGWFVFEFALGKFMANNMTSAQGFKKSDAESSLIWLFISCVAYSLLLTILFTQWTETNTLAEGVLIGGFIGGMISIMTSTYWYATSHLFNNFKPIIADIIAAVATVGFMGGVISFALGLF
ncbi:hypothetical protein K2X96_00445 [Patescibacteria group bacterium]|nr:hypothetical protein [Patescibacteria group bacterium]